LEFLNPRSLGRQGVEEETLSPTPTVRSLVEVVDAGTFKRSIPQETEHPEPFTCPTPENVFSTVTD